MKNFGPAFAWFGFLILAYVNGAFREIILIPVFKLSPSTAHWISCLTGVFLWTVLYLVVRKQLAITSLSMAAVIGLAWFAATMLFETFILNRNLSWPQVFHTYDIGAGEYWGLVLIWIGLMPAVVLVLRRALQYPL